MDTPAKMYETAAVSHLILAMDSLHLSEQYFGFAGDRMYKNRCKRILRLLAKMYEMHSGKVYLN